MGIDRNFCAKKRPNDGGDRLRLNLGFGFVHLTGCYVCFFSARSKAEIVKLGERR
jgi:hypothetical protein